MANSYNDVITNLDVSITSISSYKEINDEEKVMLENVYNINDIVINNWLGLAGDTFKELAGTIELDLMNTISFTGNCYDTTTGVVGNASRIDNDVADMLDVEEN